jgi:hypothetical protein
MRENAFAIAVPRAQGATLHQGKNSKIASVTLNATKIVRSLIFGILFLFSLGFLHPGGIAS